MRSAPEASAVAGTRTSHGLLAAAAVFGVTVLGLSLSSLTYAVQHALLVAAVFGAAATAWALFAGFGGQFSFGHAALFGLPAYGAVLANQWWGIPPLIGLVTASMVVGVGSLVVVGPALRLRGPYFALVTLALAEIARRWVNQERAVTGGEDGKVIPDTGDGLLQLGGVGEKPYLVWAGGLLVLTVTACWLFLRTTAGRRLTAVRDDQDIAETTGIDPARVKMLAYVVSAVLTGLAGGVYAYSSHIVASDALLGPSVSIAILVYAGVGGIRSIFGPALGAVVLVALEEAFRVGLGAEEPQLYRMSYAVLFALALLFLPGGLISLFQREARWRPPWRRVAPPPPEPVEPPGEVSAEAVRALLDELAPLDRHTPAAAGATLHVEGLTKRFGAAVANDDVSFEVPAGTGLAVWGHNGSGKSTLVNLLGGQLRPDGGTIRIGEVRIDRLAPYRRARLGIVRASQAARVYDDQSVLDNLLVTVFSTKRLRPLLRRDHDRAVALATAALDVVGLPRSAIGKRAGALSTGQRKRLEIARLLLGPRPRVLLLDEPTAGIDRAGVPQLAAVLRAVQAGTGAALVVVDHDQEFLLGLGSHVLCLAGGRIVDRMATDGDDVADRLERSIAVARGA